MSRMLAALKQLEGKGESARARDEETAFQASAECDPSSAVILDSSSDESPAGDAATATDEPPEPDIGWAEVWEEALTDELLTEELAGAPEAAEAAANDDAAGQLDQASLDAAEQGDDDRRRRLQAELAREQARLEQELRRRELAEAEALAAAHRQAEAAEAESLAEARRQEIAAEAERLERRRQEASQRTSLEAEEAAHRRRLQEEATTEALSLLAKHLADEKSEDEAQRDERAKAGIAEAERAEKQQKQELEAAQQQAEEQSVEQQPPTGSAAHDSSTSSLDEPSIVTFPRNPAVEPDASAGEPDASASGRRSRRKHPQIFPANDIAPEVFELRDHLFSHLSTSAAWAVVFGAVDDESARALHIADLAKALADGKQRQVLVVLPASLDMDIGASLNSEQAGIVGDAAAHPRATSIPGVFTTSPPFSSRGAMPDALALARWKRDYSSVLVVVPASSDAADLLAEQADAAYLVATIGFSDRERLADAEANWQRPGLRLSGSIL